MTNAAVPRQAHLLLSHLRPGRSVLLIGLLSCEMAPDEGVLTAVIWRRLGETNPVRQFETEVLFALVARGFICKARVGDGWRLTADGERMFDRMCATPEGCNSVASLEEPEDRPLVKSCTINRMVGTYDADECNFKHVRPGGMDFVEHPSRRGDLLHYRDGRVERVDASAPHAGYTPRRLRAWDLSQVAVPVVVAGRKKAA